MTNMTENKKPHLVDGARILRQCDRRLQRCQVNYPLGNDIIKVRYTTT